MKIKIVGIEPDVHVKFENNEYIGRRIHYSFKINGEGVGCGSQFLNDAKFKDTKIELGKVYFCDRNYGKLANFEEYPNE